MPLLSKQNKNRILKCKECNHWNVYSNTNAVPMSNENHIYIYIAFTMSQSGEIRCFASSFVWKSEVMKLFD